MAEQDQIIFFTESILFPYVILHGFLHVIMCIYWGMKLQKLINFKYGSLFLVAHIQNKIFFNLEEELALDDDQKIFLYRKIRKSMIYYAVVLIAFAVFVGMLKSFTVDGM
ncbi:hypothetical protein [Thiomicrorhabdus sp.]|uniref:hypothetical protein n=1 Tax=Thiomicrorhabdus sp. TaxID=2039724 RepID=UPI0029C83540|nr:hypothetical protein [Thiomicrorhabdus sp.]